VTGTAPPAPQPPAPAPDPAPPVPPWRSRVDAVLWWHPTAPASRGLVPAELGRPLPVALGGLIAYREGPVGPYGELFAAVGVLRGARAAGHVPFMAVDSAASIAGGRANWALPKEACTFAGADPGRPGRLGARGEGWELSATARRRPRRLPLAAAGACAQLWPDGIVRTFGVTLRGSAWAGSVEVVPAPGSAPAAWLAPGRHPALLLSGAQVVGPPAAR
jgi:hypothetical protein